MKPKPASFKVQSDFSSDRPIGSARADKLGRQEFAKGLAKRIAGWHGKDSLVVALCGEWGCGKTSLKNLIVEDLTRGKSAKVSVLEFNPWQVSGHGSLSATFFRELAIALGHKSAQSHVPKGLVSKLKAYAKVALLAGTAAKWVGKAIGGGGEESGVAVELAGEALSHSAEAASQGAEAQEARNQEQEESLTDLKRSLSAGMEELVQPVLVVIDDIDRLTSDEIREVFQLVKANADFPNLVFLLMFDREIVCTALDAISGGRGHNFLDKIVQVLFHVPQPSLKAVHKVLFDALDAFLSESGVGERWETPRWTSIWLDGLAFYFNNLRNVYRFLGSFGFHASQMRGGQCLEVNPLDLVALEALRLFEPLLYERLPQNKPLLVGRFRRRFYARDEDEKKARDEELAKLLETVSEERRGRARETLEDLFPVAFGHNSLDHDTMVRSLRVGNESVFDRYFTLSLAADDVSQSDLDGLLGTISAPGEFANKCAALNETGRLEVAFERLDAYKNELPLEAFPSAITALCNVGDTLPHNETSPIFDAKFEPLTLAWRLIYFGLKRVEDQDHRFELMRAGIKDSSGVRLPVQLASHEERLPNQSEHEFLIKEVNWAALKALVLDRLRRASQDGRLRALADLRTLLWRWLDWGSEDEVKTWVKSQLNTADDALWILRTFLFKQRLQSDRVVFIRSVSLNTLEKFADVRRIEALTSGLDLQILGNDDHRALRAFRYALKWKAEGKPDGYNGDGWGKKNPLAEDS